MREKRWIRALTALVLAASLAACGGEPPEEPEYTGPERSRGLDQRGFFQGVTAGELVTLPDYRHADIPGEIPDEQVDAALLAAVREGAGPRLITEGTVAPGDIVNIDYVGTVDGVEYDSISTHGQGAELTVGETDFFAGFLEQLIGRAVGETVEVQILMPDFYPQDITIQDMPAVFTVTINAICVYEISGESVAQLGYDSVDGARKAVGERLLREAVDSAVNGLLAQAVCREVPGDVLDTVHRITMEEYRDAAAAQGVDLTALAGQYGFESLEAFEAEAARSDALRAPLLLAAQAIAEAEGLEVTAEDVAASRYAGKVEAWGEPYIRFRLLNDEVVPAFLKGL